ncbi:uncharacterized protein LOC120006106 isoform X2 [Tripterygium wilfordii]|uniref:uncharacterized protein LOC120006106 isoform X2 n=1 Tax=Tripterygium wilfordii TaxID=458696 RepID=UPI0018F842CC|nr:uncharacterized protein LOC120006106 isoform X2 [Tripterygium wilfordii]
MADTINIAPDDDTYVVDSVFDYESFNRLFNEEDPNLANLTSINEVTAPVRPSNGFVRGSGEVPPSTGYVSWSGNGIADANANLISIGEATAPVPSADGFISGSGDSIDDPMILNFDDEFNQVNSLPGPSTIPVQNRNGGPGVPSIILVQNRNEGAGDSDNTGYGWPSLPLPFWPPLPEPFRCSCCQVLRELVHTDGTVTTKLEIHGRLGMIHHAILEIRNKINATLHTPDCHMFDFCTRSIKQVKQFLVKYCHQRKVSGFVKVQDPFSGFYEAICVGMDIENSINVNAEVDDFLNLSPTTSSGDGQTEILEADNRTTNVPKTTLAAQHHRGRERQS